MRKHTARFTYLSDRPELWADVPGLHDDVTPTGRRELEFVVGVLRSQGLLGDSTRDIQRETVRRLVSELRGELDGDPIDSNW